MVTPIDELKIRAKRLFKQSPALPALSELTDNKPLQLKHCQLFYARLIGFNDWHHALDVLSCEDKETDGYGTFWYQGNCSAILNHWCKSLGEAMAVQREKGGVILPFKNQYFVAHQDHFLQLGMDWQPELWERIDFNWCHGDADLRRQLALLRIKAFNPKVLRQQDVASL